MIPVERILEYYFGIVIVLGGLVILLGAKYTLQAWRELPEKAGSE